MTSNAASLQQVMAIEMYERISKLVAPKKMKLAQSEGDLAACMSSLNAKRNELKLVQDKLTALQDQLKMTEERKISLEKEVDLCAKKLSRADKLISGLGGEKDRYGVFTGSIEFFIGAKVLVQDEEGEG